MIQGPLIALLAGACESRAVAQWLSLTAARGVVIWARGSDRVSLGLTERDDVPTEAVGLLDVTHAFDTQTRRAAIRVAPHAAFARVGRDLWTPEARDDWTEVDDIAQAVAMLPRGARVFAATGRESLPALGQHDGPVFLRQLNRHSEPTGHAHCRFVFGAAPFEPSGEVDLLKRLNIDVVVARNIGGTGSFPKLAAARVLGLPAILLRPPPLPDGPDLRSAGDVARWVASL